MVLAVLYYKWKSQIYLKRTPTPLKCKTIYRPVVQSQLVQNLVKFNTILTKFHFIAHSYRIWWIIQEICLDGSAPKYLADLLIRHNPARPTRSQSENRLFVPFTRNKTFADRAFNVYGPNLWNDLPPNIKLIKNYHAFKSSLKTILFKKAFKCWLCHFNFSFYQFLYNFYIILLFILFYLCFYIFYFLSLHFQCTAHKIVIFHNRCSAIEVLNIIILLLSFIKKKTRF